MTESTSCSDGILQRAYDITLRDKVCSCEICKTLNAMLSSNAAFLKHLRATDP